MSINTSNTSLSKLQRIYDTQQTILDEMKYNDILLPGISAEDFKKINEAIGKLNLEEGQPDPVGDDAAVNSPFSNVDNALGKFSQNRDMDVKGLLDTYGVTAKDALDRARSLAQYEDTLGLAVSAVGPTIGKVLEAIRRDPRQTYKEMIAPLAALDYYSHEPTYDLPQPTSVGKGTRATPDTKDTFFGFNVDKKPVDPVPTDPYSPYSSEPDPVSTMTPTEQAQTMASSRLEGIGEVEAPTGSFSDDTAAQWGGYDGSDQGGGTGDTGGDIGDTSSMNTGGRVGALIQHLRTGGDVENAETNMGNANIPMGIVNDPDGAPSPFSGGTGVEDDLDMDVEAGSYVLNAESVQLIGISDINAVIRDAYSIAAALGQPMPQDYDPQNKVPIRISNGEAVIPKPLVDIIGLDKLEKWNKKGLELRKQKEKMMAQQQQAQPPQQQQVAAEAPMQQQMGQLMNEGGEVDEDSFKIDLDFIRKLDSWMAKKKPGEDYLNTNNALVLAETIATHESKGDPDARQKPRNFLTVLGNLLRTGNIWSPGRGLYQYEKNASEAAKTAVTRARNFDPNIYWLSKFDDGDFDVRKLTGREQTELFLIDHLTGVQKKKLSPAFIDVVNNNNLTAEEAFEYWLNHHKRKGSESAKRKQEFINNYNKNKDKIYKVLRRGEF